MKAIKIIAANAAELTVALKAANSRSTEHTLTDGEFILAIAEKFEDKLHHLIGNKKLANGARAVWVSGVQLPNAYKYKRTVTRLTLERRSTNWWLVSATAEQAYKDAGPEYLILTPEQDAAAHAILRRQYRLAPVAPAAVQASS